LKDYEKNLYNIINSLGDSLFVKDIKHRRVLVNDSYCQNLGFNRKDVLGKTDHELFPKKQADVFKQMDELVFSSGKDNLNEEEITDANGNTRIIHTKKALFKDNKGNKFIIGISRDITQRKEMEHRLKETLEQIQSLSLTDDPTSLNNRRGFVTLANQQMKNARRNKVPMVLLFLVLNDMKKINDKFGYQEGERALILTAGILINLYRDSDIIARIGKYEFAVLAVGTPDAHAEILINHLKETLRLYNQKAEFPHPLSLSISHSFYNPETPCSIEELLHDAEKSMYEQMQNIKKGVN
jgi:diguanylate cyclase (GGDEF)-like protein/PAS domain S-box-containing protein